MVDAGWAEVGTGEPQGVLWNSARECRLEAGEHDVEEVVSVGCGGPQWIGLLFQRQAVAVEYERHYLGDLVDAGGKFGVWG